MFKVSILPRNENRLRAVCEAAFTRASRVGPQDALDAVQEFASVPNLVAIPYLERLLAAGRTSELFDTLVQIGGADARAALERLASNPTDSLAANARAALRRVH
jgi:hypothetical protein